MSILSTPYPHLLPEDAAVWKRWLEQYGYMFDRFDYDVKVGTGRDPGRDFDPATRQMAVTLSQRRIDAIGYRPGWTFLFEVTRLADLKCLGQIQAYPLLYARTYHPLTPIRTCVVCEQIGTDLKATYNLAHVTVYRV